MVDPRSKYREITALFLKLGSISFGGPAAHTALMESEVVRKKKWMDHGHFLDLLGATFIGYQMGGIWGAVLATAGIFLPSFFFVAVLNPMIPKLRKSGLMSAFLDAVNIASVAVILSITIDMGKATLNDWRAIAIALCSMVALLVFKKLNSAVIVIGGAVLGYILLIF